MKMRAVGSRAACVILLLLVGCPMSRRAQLHRVAKDWCETIRASQVIAVYPLTQDVQPGDVFLVQTPIDKQQEIYRTDGFLPLDNHLARLDPWGYSNFYRRSFLADNPGSVLPSEWLKAKWTSAPSAAFPSYAFSVSKSGGLNLAIPVSGVPVGLSLLATQSATGTISLKDARTIGVDTESLYLQLRQWADNPGAPERREFLAGFSVEPGEHPRNYLRVITRVYLLGAIDVQLNDARSFGAGADVGAARPVELFLPDVPRGTEDVRRAGQETYLRGVQRLNAMGGTGVPKSSTGADPTLSSGEFAAREKARAAERTAEVKRAQDERKEAEEAYENAKKDAAESAEGQALETAKTDLEAARKIRSEKEEALAAARREDPPDETKITEAKEALTAAEADVHAKEEVLANAQKAFDDKHAAAIQAAAGKLEVKQSALDRLQEFAPGGSFRFNAASSRSVSMSETFAVPLVVGYLGFDVPIGVDGELGHPIPTYARLQALAAAPPVATTPASEVYETATKQNLYDLLCEVAKQGDETAIRTRNSLDGMSRFMEDGIPKFRLMRDGARSLTIEEPPTKDKNYGGYLIFRTERDDAVRGLLAAADADNSVTEGDTELSGEDLRRRARELSETRAEARASEAAERRLRKFWCR